MKFILFSFLVSTSVFAAGVASAGTCEVSRESERYVADVLKVIGEKKNCAQAADTAELCAVGGTMDGQFAASAQERCEADFISKLKAKSVALIAYRKFQKECALKSASENASMAESDNGYCRLDIAKFYSAHYSL